MVGKCRMPLIWILLILVCVWSGGCGGGDQSDSGESSNPGNPDNPSEVSLPDILVNGATVQLDFLFYGDEGSSLFTRQNDIFVLTRKSGAFAGDDCLAMATQEDTKMVVRLEEQDSLSAQAAAAWVVTAASTAVWEMAFDTADLSYADRVRQAAATSRTDFRLLALWVNGVDILVTLTSRDEVPDEDNGGGDDPDPENPDPTDPDPSDPDPDPENPDPSPDPDPNPSPDPDPDPDPTPSPSVEVTGVTLSQTSLNLETGHTGTLTATISPSNATDKTITWSSSNTSVASVSGGTVSAVAAGTATITATSNNGKIATCSVTVIDPTPPPASYTVTFDSQGGSSVTSSTVTSGQTVSAPSDPTRAGYTFAGWYTDSAGMSVYDFSTPVTGNLTLYAKWTATSYTITYVLDGGTNAAANPTTYSVESTFPITLANPTKTNYRFKGWYDAATGGNQVTQIAANSTGDVTVYARWEAKVTGVKLNKSVLQLIWNDHGGSGTPTTSSETLTFTLTPSEAVVESIEWSTDKENIVNVVKQTDGSGKVTTIGLGTGATSETNTATVNVTVTIDDVQATCSVTVSRTTGS